MSTPLSGFSELWFRQVEAVAWATRHQNRQPSDRPEPPRTGDARDLIYGRVTTADPSAAAADLAAASGEEAHEVAGYEAAAFVVGTVFVAPPLTHATETATSLVVCPDIHNQFRELLNGGARVVRSVVHDVYGRHAVVEVGDGAVVELWEPVG